MTGWPWKGDEPNLPLVLTTVVVAGVLVRGGVVVSVVAGLVVVRVAVGGVLGGPVVVSGSGVVT